MKFSIITVVYNDMENLKKTLCSVKKQTFDDYEHLIIDGGSTDGTVGLLERLSAENSHIRYISGRDKGVYDAMNKGAAAAKGEYILFLNAADKFAKRDTLKEAAELLSDGTEVLYGRCLTSSGEKKGEVFGGRLTFFEILFSRYVAHQSVFARRELLMRYPFDLSYRYQADQDFMFRVKKGGHKMKYVDKIIALYDGNGISSQSSLIDDYRKERCRTLKRYCPAAYLIREAAYYVKFRRFF